MLPFCVTHLPGETCSMEHHLQGSSMTQTGERRHAEGALWKQEVY